MRNKFPGICYRCNQRVETGEGHFERYRHGWRVQHANCAIKARKEKAEPGKLTEHFAKPTGRWMNGRKP